MKDYDNTNRFYKMNISDIEQEIPAKSADRKMLDQIILRIYYIFISKKPKC